MVNFASGPVSASLVVRSFRLWWSAFASRAVIPGQRLHVCKPVKLTQGGWFTVTTATGLV